MPLPDNLPPEVWHRIVEVGTFFSTDLQAMLAVAPQTTAKGMHDAAFSSRFGNLYLGIFEKNDLLRLTLMLCSYIKPDSLPLRSAVRYINVFIDTDVIYSRMGGTSDVETYLRTLSKFEDLVCYVLTDLPNLMGLYWFDSPHTVSDRKDHRWKSIETRLPQLTELTLCGFHFEHSLDLRAAKALRTLSIKNCRFDLRHKQPWIISDVRLHQLSISMSGDDPNTLDTVNLMDNTQAGASEATAVSTNAFSAFDFSYLSTFSLTLSNLNPENFSYIFPSPSWKGRSGLGRYLRSLVLFSVDYDMAVALGNADTLPSLRACYLRYTGSRTTSNWQAHEAVEPLCAFLSRQTSLETLLFGISKNVSQNETRHALETYDLALRSESFVDMLRRLKNLQLLKLLGFSFSDLCIPPPLTNLEVLIVHTSRSVPLIEEVAVASSVRLQGYAGLRSFSLEIDNPTVPEDTIENGRIGTHTDAAFANKLGQFAPQILFAEFNHVKYWLRNIDDAGNVEELHSCHPVFQRYTDLHSKYNEMLVF